MVRSFLLCFCLGLDRTELVRLAEVVQAGQQQERAECQCRDIGGRYGQPYTGKAKDLREKQQIDDDSQQIAGKGHQGRSTPIRNGREKSGNEEIEAAEQEGEGEQAEARERDIIDMAAFGQE